MKKNKGFTLIELLAVIVILAIIALIVVPQVIKILNKARLSSTEDSVYGIVKSAENYITEFMLKNNGELPNQDLTFSCGNEGCSLNEKDKLSSYNLTDLEKINYKGTEATGGLVKVHENGSIEVRNLLINGFKCNYPVDEKAKCYTSDDLKDSLKINTISLMPSLNSIKVVLNISGNASKYEYSIDNVNYYEGTDNTYTFDNLEANQEYTIYVRVSNANEKYESTNTGRTSQLSAPSVDVDEEKIDVWAQSKTVMIKYPSGENLKYSYKIESLDRKTILVDETIVTEETINIEVTENSLVVATVTLGSNSQPKSSEVTKIDRTAPTKSSFEYEVIDNSIKVIASGEDLESGIYGYQFSIDNGSTWLPSEPQKENIYIFNELNEKSYIVIVRSVNGTYDKSLNELNYLNSDAQIIKFNSFKVKKISAGERHTLAIDLNDNLWTWGDNAYGQLGNGNIHSSTNPTKIIPDVKIKEISAGKNHSMAIDIDGNLWVWGKNNSGQLGDNTTNMVKNPKKIMEGTKFVKISAGENHSAAVDVDGNLWMWGGNNSGQFGDDTTQSSKVPKQISTYAKVKDVSIKLNNSMILDINNDTWICGGNDNHELGNGTTTKSYTFKKISINSINYIENGFFNSFVINGSGTIYEWGNGNYGQLGNYGTSAIYYPSKLSLSVNIKMVSLGMYHTLLLDNSGKIWVTGSNNKGQLGDGSIVSTTNYITSFKKIIPDINFIYISAGYTNSYAIDSDYNLWSWGDGNNTPVIVEINE